MALYSNATIKRLIIAANEIDNRIEYLNRRDIPTDIPNKPKQKLIEIGIWDDEGCFNSKYHDQTQYNFITDWYEKNYC